MTEKTEDLKIEKHARYVNKSGQSVMIILATVGKTTGAKLFVGDNGLVFTEDGKVAKYSSDRTLLNAFDEGDLMEKLV